MHGKCAFIVRQVSNIYDAQEGKEIEKYIYIQTHGERDKVTDSSFVYAIIATMGS
jgi:hypothetical protein